MGKNTLLETFWNPLRATHDVGMQRDLHDKPTISTGSDTADFDAAHPLMLACRLTGTLLNYIMKLKLTEKGKAK
ncbi:hypothetical protein R50072_36680 [Simiduia litorea]